MNQALLSVIVPCYQVEKYIDKCISSIVQQTHTDLEIILIDDGSTDKTGALCDIWQEKDSRIRAVHQQNEGSSMARKRGVDLATGEYITFADADDWIDKDMYANMLAALKNTHSDIVQCDLCKVYEDGRMEHRVNQELKNTVEVFGRIEGALLILEDLKWQSWMCNKIFKKHLFNDIEFPKDRLCFDDYITLFLFHKASQTAYLHSEYYYYLQRSDSISNDKKMPAEIKKLGDACDAYWERCSFVKQHPEYHTFLPQLETNVICLTLHLLRAVIVFSRDYNDDYFYEKAKRLHAVSLHRKNKLQRSIKTEYYLAKFVPKSYKFIRTLYAGMIHLSNRLKITNKRTHNTISDLWYYLYE